MRSNIYSRTLLSAILLLSSGISALHAQVKQNGITYTKNATATGYIVTAHENQENVVIANEIDGLPVTEIAEKAFENAKKLKSLTIANSIEKIGQYAFQGCTALSAINFEEGKDLTICRWAFNGCTALTSLTLPSTLAKFDNNGHFKDCKNLSSVTFKENNKLVDLGGYCFENCTALKTIDLTPLKATTSIRGVFKGSGIKSVIFPAKLNTIAEQAFTNCASLTNIVIPASVTTLGDRAFVNNSAIKTVDFEEGSKLTIIDSWAFHNCINLESIAIEKCEHLTTIKDRSIRYNKLTKIIIPKNVTSIGDWAFQQKIGESAIKYIVFMKEGGNWSDVAIKASAFAGIAVNLYAYKNIAGTVQNIDNIDNGNNTKGKEIYAPVAPIEIKNNCDGYTTYFTSNAAIKLPKDVKAYKVSAVAQNKATLTEIPAEAVLPKGTPVVIKGQPGLYYPQILPEDATPAFTDNMLKGTENAEEVKDANVYYKLSLNDAAQAGTAGFYWGAANGAAFTNTANMAYLALNTSLGNMLALSLPNATSIQLKPMTTNNTNTRYNLSGARVNSAYKGLLIMNGKKVIIK